MAGVDVSGDGGPGLLRRKGPELLLEAFFVVFAVLVALAVDEWNEERELQARVERARAAVVAELEANREELAARLGTVEEMYRTVSDVAARLGEGEEVTEWSVSAQIPEFTDAAWETARVTGTVAHMEYAWVLDVARAYESQTLAFDLQNRLMVTVGAAFARRPDYERVTDLQGELLILLQIYGSLEDKYAEVLDAPG